MGSFVIFTTVRLPKWAGQGKSHRRELGLRPKSSAAITLPPGRNRWDHTVLSSELHQPPGMFLGHTLPTWRSLAMPSTCCQGTKKPSKTPTKRYDESVFTSNVLSYRQCFKFVIYQKSLFFLFLPFFSLSLVECDIVKFHWREKKNP